MRYLRPRFSPLASRTPCSVREANALVMATSLNLRRLEEVLQFAAGQACEVSGFKHSKKVAVVGVMQNEQ